MPVRPRHNTGQFVFHVFNRAIQTLVLFEQPGDYEMFLGIIREAADHYHMRILAYAVMPNHWHVVLWPPDDSCLSAFMQRITVRHAKRWREMRGSTGRGAVYQGRFRAVAIQRDDHFLRACRYVERNPLRARLVHAAEDWPWSSASPGAGRDDRPALAPWPVPKPADWRDWLNVPEPPGDLKEIRRAIRRGLPYGNITWRAGTMRRLRWAVGGRRGRPPGSGTVPCRELIRAMGR